MNTSEQLIAQIKETGAHWQGLKNEVHHAIVGQETIIDRVCIGLLCDGHILLEGVPGLAKTTIVKTIAQVIGLDFARIQFTPDLLPSDLIGTLIYHPKTHEFQTKKGPIFTNIVLSDEINRAPAKVQSALLEAMQEHQVTIGGTTHRLEEPFLVLATQNPIEQEGTYRLPEAQLDRFMFKLHLTYPSHNQEKEIISKVFKPHTIRQILTKDDLLKARKQVAQVYVDEKVTDYLVNLVCATRDPGAYNLESLTTMIAHGASPRATLTLHQAARAHAFLRGRHFVMPEDIKTIAADVLRHRILLTYEAEADHITTDQIIEQILATVPSP